MDWMRDADALCEEEESLHENAARGADAAKRVDGREDGRMGVEHGGEEGVAHDLKGKGNQTSGAEEGLEARFEESNGSRVSECLGRILVLALAVWPTVACLAADAALPTCAAPGGDIIDEKGELGVWEVEGASRSSLGFVRVCQ